MAYHNNNKKALNRNGKDQTSIIKDMMPYMCVDTETGEILTPTDYEPLIVNLITYVCDKTENLATTREQDIKNMLDDPKCPKQAVGAMQRYGINADVSDLAKGIHQPYRINRLIMHKTFTEYKAYHENQDPKKKPPTWSNKINLGAVDSQMATISWDTEHQVAALQWKCWSRDITLFFHVPDYVLDYNIGKFCLPSVQCDDDGSNVTFFLSVNELLDYQVDHKSCHQKRIIAGYDLGRAKAFTLTVMTDTGKVIAKRQASPRTRDLNDKRERILADKKVLKDKIATYDALGIHPPKYDVYLIEIERLAGKAKRLGHELAMMVGADIARLCGHHGVDIVAGEDLSWVNDTHGSSRWVYGQVQNQVAHAVRHAGVKHFTVSARDTSKQCPKCGSKNSRYDSKSRVLECLDCSHSEDRDDWAGEVIAARKTRVVLRARMKELLEERVLRARAGSVFSSINFSSGWCPGGLAARRGLAVVPFLGQAFLPYGITALFWNSHSMSWESPKTSKL